MSTQQDIYAAGSKSRPPMINKENYVPWSSRLLRYAKSRPNEKLIHKSIINGPYVRRMIPELAVDSCETAQEIWLRVQQMMKGSDIGIQEKKAKLFNEWERFTSNEGESIESYYHRNLNGYNAVQNNGNGNLVVARAERNAAGHNENQIRCYNCRGVGHFASNCTVRPRRRDAAYLQTQLLIAQKEEAGIQLQAKEFDLMAAAADLDEIEKVNANCILMANLQQASTSGTQTDKAPVYDLDGSAEEKSTVSFLLKETKKLKSDFKTREDELLDKQIQLEKKIKELNNILVKTGQSIQTIHMLSPKPDSFYHTEQKMALGYQNPFYLKQAQKKQQSLYEGKVLLEKHDPPVVHDSEETLQLAQESHEKMKQLNKKIKPANYTKINHLSGVFVSQTSKSRKELYFSNDFKTANVSKSISIPNEEFSNDTTPSVARKFLNEVKSTIVTLQRVVKHIMSLETHNWSSSAHQELHKIVRDENFIIVNQVNAREQNFEIQFLKKAAKFVGDFKSLAKEADDPLAKHKALELEIERLLRAVDNKRGTSANTKFAKQSIVENLPKVGATHALSKPVTSNSVPTPQESKVVKNDKVIAPGMFRINSFKTSMEAKHVPNNVRASARTKPITVSQPSVITKKDENSDSNGLSSSRIDNIKTRRPQPRSNTKNDMVPSASKSSRSKNKDAEVEEHHRNLLLSKNTKHMSSACNIIKLDSQNVISKVVCAVCKQCLISVNHDVCLRNYVNGKTSRGKILESSASESQSDCSNGDNACTYNTLEPKIKRFPNSTSMLGRVVERKNRTLVEAARTMLIFSRALLFLWAEVIATACFSQNRSIIHHRFNKTPYELINGRKPDISFLHVFGALCYPKNDREDIGKLGAKGFLSASRCSFLVIFSRPLDVYVSLSNIILLKARLTEKHLKEVKRIFRYLRGTVNTGLWYTKDSDFELTGFSDDDYAGCKDTFKSTSGGAHFLGEKLVSWSCAQVLWMRAQLTDYGFHFNKILIYCDSKSDIAISCNPVQHSRTKHITVRYHFIKKHVEKGTIELYFVKTDYQLADLFTKALPADRFNYLVHRLGMRSLSPQELDRLAKSQ
nr:copia protein [Tanacetum cinerariifolium]